MLRDREYAMRIFFVPVFLVFIAAGCAPYFTRHYEDSFFAVGRDKKFSVEIVTGKKDLNLEANTVGIIVHDANDEDVEQADLAITAVVQDNVRQREVIYTVTEKGRGLYTMEFLDFKQSGIRQLRVRVKKDNDEDISVFNFLTHLER
jgi:hypothetical protein